MNYKEKTKYFDELAKIRVKCKCSHTLYFPVYAPDIQICNHCGHKVYRNEKVKFINLMSETLKNGRCNYAKDLSF